MNTNNSNSNQQIVIEERITQLLVEKFGVQPNDYQISQCQGGDIHQSFAARSAQLQAAAFFIKTNTKQHANVLASEFASLTELQNLYASGYPAALAFEQDQHYAYLLLPYLALTPLTSATAGAAGELLAKQHRVTHPRFGWAQDNYIGLTKQINNWQHDWATFYRDARLTPLLKLAQQRGLAGSDSDAIESICETLLARLDGHRPTASLLHGDLWAGNAGYESQNQRPLFYDPAPYFGDRETDLAMSELFGGFPSEFLQVYQRVWPLEAGYQRRRPLYNLYHALNHYVIFGHGYLPLVRAQLQQINNF